MLLSLIFITFLVSSSQSELKILETPSGKLGPAPCAITCSGVKANSWSNSGDYPGKAYMFLSFVKCGFVDTPIITVSTFGGGLCPPVTVRDGGRKGFLVYTFEDATAADMESMKCVLQWSAFGYSC